MSWRSTLEGLLGSGSFRTQGELVHALSEAGHKVDQAAISRELRWLEVRKVDGVYRLPGSGPSVPVHRLVDTANGCLAVVVTDAAYAMVLGQAIDDAGLEGVLGTVAGDDTVFVATTGAKATRALARWLGVPVVRTESRRSNARR